MSTDEFRKRIAVETWRAIVTRDGVPTDPVVLDVVVRRCWEAAAAMEAAAPEPEPVKAKARRGDSRQPCIFPEPLAAAIAGTYGDRLDLRQRKQLERAAADYGEDRVIRALRFCFMKRLPFADVLSVTRRESWKATDAIVGTNGDPTRQIAEPGKYDQFARHV